MLSYLLRGRRTRTNACRDSFVVLFVFYLFSARLFDFTFIFVPSLSWLLYLEIAQTSVCNLDFFFFLRKGKKKKKETNSHLCFFGPRDICLGFYSGNFFFKKKIKKKLVEDLGWNLKFAFISFCVFNFQDIFFEAWSPFSFYSPPPFLYFYYCLKLRVSTALPFLLICLFCLSSLEITFCIISFYFCLIWIACLFPCMIPKSSSYSSRG